ncbi:pirin family protein [Thalassotalea maritima]|uniref:pirin family protein n=1 Tax=Thalassotalea maritima TaxID=3242416 RepID=UPI003529345B
MKIIDITKASATQDGAGVKISRVADFSGKGLDPFLMIDELKSDDKNDFIGGFPAHPHRGIETFTYMIKGGFEHQDQMGNKKAILEGDVQWMSTGFGVVHSEMPIASDDGMHGFQIWVNMPAKDKLRDPMYKDSVATPLPVIQLGQGSYLKALAGTWAIEDSEVRSPLSELSADAAIADLRIKQGQTIRIDRSAYEQAFVYIHSGEINDVKAAHLIRVDSSQPLIFTAKEDAGALIFSGNKIREKIAHMGPFVMNTQAELRQAVEDYHAGRMGTID